jgi:Ribonuclease HII
VTPGGGQAIMAAVEQLTFGNGPAAAPAAAASAAAGPAGPGYEIERELAVAGPGCVAGVDEVGRGAWAGPVTVCAVIVQAGFPARLADGPPRRGE